MNPPNTNPSVFWQTTPEPEPPPHTTAIPQTYPLWIHFPHINRTYRVIGWEHHNHNWCPIIITTQGQNTGLGNTIHNLGSGTWQVTYTETGPCHAHAHPQDDPQAANHEAAKDPDLPTNPPPQEAAPNTAAAAAPPAPSSSSS